MSANQHNSAHAHPPGATRGTRLDSKVGKRITLKRLEKLLKRPPDPEEKAT